MKGIKYWWRKQEFYFKRDLKFNGIILFVGILFLIVFGSPALMCIITPLIINTLFYSYIFRVEKYFWIKAIKRHKDCIYLSKQLGEHQDKLIHNLKDRIKSYEKLLNSTYMFVPWPESQKFTIHKRFNDCCVVENGCMVPYDIYKETLINLENNGN